jgi:hypothetical protein
MFIFWTRIGLYVVVMKILQNLTNIRLNASLVEALPFSTKIIKAIFTVQHGHYHGAHAMWTLGPKRFY